MNNNLNSVLTQLAVSAPFESRGSFRWLHNHYMWRYGMMHKESLVSGLNEELWSLLQDIPEPLYTRVENKDLLLDVVNIHAWTMGIKGFKDTVFACWDRMEPLSRASFLAAMSERGDADPYFNMLVTFGEQLEYSTDSFCQLACNAIYYNRLDTLEHLFAQPVNFTATVRRFPAFDSSRDWENQEIEKLCHRLIDMILESALIRNSPIAVKLALQHGADPNLPVFQLERSYNSKYSALGYVIDSEFMYDMESRKEMVEILLDHGASAAGIAYSGHNRELFLALEKGWDNLSERLILMGSGLSKTAGQEKGAAVRTEGSESIVIGPGGPNFFGHFGDKLKWAHENIGSIIPLVPVSEKQAFFSSNGQGGSKSTMMDKVVGNLERLKRYEALGLDTRLSAEELCTAIDVGAFDSLVYLLSKYGDSARDRAMFRIRRYKPDIGASWRHMDVLPQEDGVNIATECNQHGLEPFTLPDGSKLHVDLSAIAPSGHNHGTCFAGHFWLRTDTVILRRRKDKVIVRRLEKKWGMEPLPLRKPGTCSAGQHYLDDCLPLIREIDGRFIHLGMTLHGVNWRLPECELKNTSAPWRDLPAYVALLDQAEDRIRQQVGWNKRPVEPVLSEIDLRGYPPHFWPYLVHLTNGCISMTSESSKENRSVLGEYKSWARKAKEHERNFKPDLKLLEWEHWSEVPPDYRPYLYIDTMFNSRVSVIGGDYYNRYKYAMSEKVKSWLWDRKQAWREETKSVLI